MKSVNRNSILAEIKEEPSETPEPTPESTPEPMSSRIELTPDDYNEHYYEINTCGKEGKDPPKEKECKASNGKWFNKELHNYDQINGIHKWIVREQNPYYRTAGGIGGSIKDAEENGIVVIWKRAIMKLYFT